MPDEKIIKKLRKIKKKGKNDWPVEAMWNTKRKKIKTNKHKKGKGSNIKKRKQICKIYII